MKSKFSIFSVFKIIFLSIVVFITIFPFVHMIAVSMSGNIYVLKNQIVFFPKGFNLKVYGLIFKNHEFFRSYLNTILYTILGTTISLTITCMGAYALSKKKLIFHRFFSLMVLFTMYFYGGLIPTYLTVKSLGMVNHIWAILLPGAVGTWYLIIMRTFFTQFPSEIEESGKIDGLTEIGNFFRLVLPLSKPVLASIGLFYAVGIWNSYFGAMIYINSREKWPIQLVLRDMLLQGAQTNNKAVSAGGDMVLDDPLKYASILISVLPIIVVYPFVQKYFVKGVMIGSVKG